MRFQSQRVQQLKLSGYDLNKRSVKHANKSTLVARDADTQLGSSCVSAPLATNVDLLNPIAMTMITTLASSSSAWTQLVALCSSVYPCNPRTAGAHGDIKKVPVLPENTG